MKRLVQIINLLIGIALFINACSPKDTLPRNVLSVKKMSAIMLDMELADAYNPSYYSRTAGDSIYPDNQEDRLQVFYQQILEMHEIDTTTFFHSLRYYTHHPDWIVKVYNNIKDSVDSRLAAIQGQKEKERNRNQVIPYMEFWKEDIKTMHTFYDSLTHQNSQIFYPWDIFKEQKSYFNQRIWNQHFEILHNFFDSLQQKHSTFEIPGLPENDQEEQEPHFNKRIWNQHFEDLHNFFDSIQQKHSAFEIPGLPKKD